MSDIGIDDLEGRDAAAEYVLGVLDAAEQAAFTRAAAADQALQAAITDWERRLAPLARLVEPMPPPPALWDRLAASIAAPTARVVPFARPAATDSRVRRWQAATAVSLALAACLAVVAALPVLRPAPAPILLVASLATYGQPAAGFLATVDRGTLTVRPTAALATVPTGRDLELWSLPPGAKAPAPLGVLPANGARLTGSAAAPGTQILISLEPRGGSPTGLPTGPVLFAGTLTQLD